MSGWFRTQSSSPDHIPAGLGPHWYAFISTALHSVFTHLENVKVMSQFCLLTPAQRFKHNRTHDTDRKTLPVPVQFLWCCKTTDEPWINRESKNVSIPMMKDMKKNLGSWGFEYFTVYFMLLDYQWKAKEWTSLTFLPLMKHLQDFQLTLTSLTQRFSNFMPPSW